MVKVYSNSYIKDILAIAALSGAHVHENEMNRLSNLPIHRDKSTSGISISKIFKEFWDELYALYKDNIRPSIVKNVEAMIRCRDFYYGYTYFECKNCDNYHILGFSCNSRFCSSCGKRYRDQRALNIQSKLINVPHRHFVFSVPFNLRPLFWKCRKLFDCLFKSVNEALLITLGRSKKEKHNDYRLGYVAFLHTYGRSLNMHPHLHVLLAEEKIDRFGNSKRNFFFPFEMLRKTFRNRFLNNANNVIKKHGSKSLYREFNILRTKIMKQYKDGFYIHGPKLNNKNNIIKSSKSAADYISRYASHPPISERNILELNIENKTVTWTYTPHENDNEPVIITEHVFDFIKKLIIHIPDSNTHILRYYGFYANRATNRIKNHRKLVAQFKIKQLKLELKWRIMIKKSYLFDPLICHCGSLMTINYDMSYYGENNWRYDKDG